MSIDNDYYASQFNKKFFENGAQMAGILITKEELSDDSYKRLLDTFNDRHQGVNKSHKVGLLEAGVDFKSLNFSHKDMDFVGLKDRSKQEICVTWKVNEVVLGEYANIKSYEGINACHRTFWHECLLPKMRYVEKVLNAMLFSRIMGAKGKYVFSFDKTNIEALKEDLVTKTMVGQFFINWGWTPNQVNTRLRLNLPKLPWGDSALIQNNRIPVGSKKELSNLMPETNPYGIGNPEPGKEIAPKEPTKNMFDGTVKALSNLISKLDSSNTKTNSVYDNYIRIEESLEKRLREKLRNYFYQQRKQVLNNFYDIYGSKANKADDYVPLAFEFADNVEIQKLVGILRPFYTEALQSGADMVIAELGKEGQADVFADSFQDWVAAKLDFTPKEIVGTVKTELGKLVSSGLADKLETSEIASMIKTFYNTVGNNNSFTIARTEMAAAVSAGRFSEMSLQGVKKHKWVTEKDGRVRETHKLLEGAIAIIGEAFKYSNGSASPLRYPGDSAAPAEEVVNCRCIAIIVS